MYDDEQTMTDLVTTAWASNGRDVVKIEGPLDPRQLKDAEFEFGKIKLSNDMIKRLACELNEIRAQKFYGVILSEDIELAIAYCNEPSLRGDTENE